MKYLYCVIPTNKQETIDVRGIGGQVYTIPYEDISLVVSDSESIPFTSIRKEELFNHLLIHQATIEKIMQRYSVIPLKFGTFFDEEKEIQKIMKKGYPLFKESLDNLNGKIELNLVAMWANLNEVLKEIGEMNQIQQLKEKIFQRPSSERVQSGIELGKIVKDLLDTKRDTIAEEIITRIGRTLSSTDEIETISSTRSRGCLILDICRHAVLNDSMICNIAFLIDKNKKDNFDQALDELDKRISAKGGEAGINFKMVGPLPPYSFATFEIKKLAPEEIFYAKTLLGTTEKPGPEEVKRAYHGMAQKLHPDKNLDNPDAASQFEELKKAFDLLYEYSSNDGDLFLVKKLSWEQQ